MKICSFGSLNVDHVYDVEHFVQPGETISSLRYSSICGGKGLNQSIAMARAGARVRHVGNVGEDDGGRMLRAALRESGVDEALVRTLPARASGHAIIQVDKRGQNCILLHGGANLKASRAQIDAALAEFKPGDLLVLQNEVNELPYLVAQGAARGLRVVLNPSPMNAVITSLPLEQVSIFFLNEIEALQLAGVEAEDAALDALVQRYPETMLVVTRGAEGSEVVHRGERHYCPAYQVNAVDTTAAGDTYTGYFLAAWAEGLSIPSCMTLATRAAALCVARYGASASIPTRSEVKNSVF